MLNKQNLTIKIKTEASRLGFDSIGISKAEFLEEDAPRLEEWLKKGFHGEMHYMENHFEKRLDPRLLVPGAKSVISLSYNYFPKESHTSYSYIHILYFFKTCDGAKIQSNHRQTHSWP